MSKSVHCRLYLYINLINLNLIVSYGLMAAVSTIVGEAMEPYLETIVSSMVDSVLSEKGLTVCDKSS